MKFHNGIVVLALLVFIFFSACSEDFKVNAPYKPVTIIYGLLDKGDTAHYIKIQKGFFDENGNNLVAAKNPDSLYHTNLNVTLQNLAGGSAIVLSKVDLVAEGIVKDTGVFAHSPAYAYKTKNVLLADARYKLTVQDPATGQVLSSETVLLSNDPSKFYCEQLLFDPVLSFSDPAGKSTFKIYMPQNISLLEMYLRVNYFEMISNGTDTVGVMKRVEVPFFTRQEVKNNYYNFIIDNKELYGRLGSAMGSAGFNTRRLIDTPDVIFYAGGAELKKYIDVTAAQGGITADEIKPIYTNIIGANAYGLFSSRVRRIYYEVPFTPATIDSLKFSILAKDLRITGITPD